MDAHESWQCQGRQYHGWFGDGTCADSGLSHDRRADAAETAKARKTLAVLYGAVGALPASQRRRWEGWLQHGGAASLSRVVGAWSAAWLDYTVFRARFLPDRMGGRINAAAHDIADTVATGAAGASAAAAEEMFGRLTKGRGGIDVTPPGHIGRVVRLPDGSYIGYRSSSRTGGPAVDVNSPSVANVKKLHY